VSDSEHRKPGEHLPYIDESLVINTRLKEIERRQEEEKAEEKEYKRRQLIFNRWTVIFTGLLFVTSGVSDWLLLRQVSINRESSDAAKDAAKSAQDAVLVAQGQLIQSLNAADASDTNSQTAMTSSEKQSVSALNASRDALRLEQRPWVVASTFELAAEPITGNSVSVTTYAVNTGRTPAIDVTTRTSLSISNVVPPFPNLPLPEHVNYRGIIAPSPSITDRTYSFKHEDPPITIPDRFVQPYKDQRFTIYIYAVIRYRDVFKIPHWTAICAMHKFGQSLSEFNNCPYGNELDQNQKATDPIDPPRPVTSRP